MALVMKIGSQRVLHTNQASDHIWKLIFIHYRFRFIILRVSVMYTLANVIHEKIHENKFIGNSISKTGLNGSY